MADAASGNPLLSVDFRIPFDQISADHVRPAVAELLGQARRALDDIANDPRPRTFETTLRALDELTERLDYALGIVGHLESVATTPPFREAYNEVQPQVSEFYSSIPLHAGLFRAIKSYAAMPEAEALKGVRARFVEKTIADFRRHGAELDDEGKAALSKIDVELTRLTIKYAQNVLDSTNAFEFVVDSRDKLLGLPDNAIEAARESAASKGKAGYRFTLQAPSYMPLVTYLADRTIREHVYRAYHTRATRDPWDNRPIVRRILELRRARASLLGYAHFADLVLEDRMAKTGAQAEQFVATLTEKVRGFFERENAALAAFRGALEGPDCGTLEPWDVAYYAEKQRAALYDFDEEALRPYFAADRVLAGMFDIATRLYGIRVEPWVDAPTWHPSVQRFTLRDMDGSWLGSFYVDLYPRESKRGGAWMDGLITGVWSPERRTRHLGVLCANCSPPVGHGPALLTHREVKTLFHEFGHLLHHCLSRVELRSLAGVRVAWDFVELPSQIMENWCWERDALDIFARHCETNEPIPNATWERMLAARNFRSANLTMRQLGFATVDLALHVHYAPERDGDPVAYARTRLIQFSPAPLPDEHAMVAAFTHLFANPVGYAAGYYSYKWAEVLDADAFTRFQREGIFNRSVGDQFRDSVLSRGDGEDAADLFRRFMGRSPDPDALLRRSGLT